MLRKKLQVGAAILIAAQMVALACYSSSSRSCPARASRGSFLCSLVQGNTYPWVVPNSTGWTDAKSDGAYHCRYQCPNGSYFWAFPGAVTTGSSCGGG